MYRLMLYFMISLLGMAVGLSAIGVLPYSAGNIFLQTVAFVALCWAVNTLIARVLHIQANIESALITGLILAAIVGPLSLLDQWLVVVVTTLAAIFSKYLFVFKRSHVFNPAAFGAVVSAIVLGHPASWWIGSRALLPVVILGGLLVMQKIRRWHLTASFLGVYLGLLALDAVVVRGRGLSDTAFFLTNLLAVTPLLYFSFVMLIEPLTAPQTNSRRTFFGVLVGLALFSLQRFLSAIPYSLELSLLIGNICTRVISLDFRQSFVLRKKEIVDSVIGNFWFEPARPFVFAPGQFLEYTFAHSHPDARGVRRYYSIASSPTEPRVLLSTKFSQPGSTFKQALLDMKAGDEIIASKVAGDFVLPSDPQQRLAFIAGGIGITPFRSMVKYLLDTNQARDIVLLYGAREEKDLVFRDMFEEAREKFGMRTISVLSKMIDQNIIQKEVPDFTDRLFYVSGPEPMVHGVTKLLAGMKIPRKRIKCDYFPGYEAI